LINRSRIVLEDVKKTTSIINIINKGVIQAAFD